MVDVSEALEIEKILEFSGFDESAQQTIIVPYGFESYGDILMLGDSDILNPAKVFSDRTVAAGKISFGWCWNTLLKATIYWAQDLKRISRTPSLIGIIITAKFRAAIEEAR